jgi:hypothetical protein
VLRFVTSVCLLWAGASLAAAAPAAAVSSDLLLPNTTIAYASSPNLDELLSSLERSQLGQFWNDAKMQPFVQQVRSDPNVLWARAERNAGFTLGELREAAAGEVSIATVEVEANDFSVILLADCRGNDQRARALMAQAAQRLQQRGATPLAHKLAGAPLQAFSLPADSGKATQMVHFYKDGILGVASDIQLVEIILPRWPGQSDGSLASSPAYRDVMERTGGLGATQLRWFCVPVKLAKCTHEPDPELEGEDDPEKVAKRHGVDALGGVGGCVSLKAEGVDLRHRTSVYAPPPLSSSMGILSFPSGGDLACLPWIPADVSSYITIHIDLLNAFDHCSILFDDLIADGLEGTFEEFLGDLKSEEGPQVDLKADLVAHLGNRAAVLSQYRTPVSETSDGDVAVLEVKDEGRVALAVKRLFRDDPGATQVRVAGHTYPLWKIGDDETVSFPGENAALTSFGVMVAQKHLLIASDFEFIQRLLGKPAGKDKLADSPVFQSVTRGLKELGEEDASMRAFSHIDRDLFTTYERLRLGKAEDADSMYAMLISALFTDAARINFTALPEFDQVKHYFGCAGMLGKNHDKGWLLEGFVAPSKQ